MSVSREELLKECGQELDVTIIHEIDINHAYVPDYGPGCARCGVNFEDHINKTIGYEPEQTTKSQWTPEAQRDLEAMHSSSNNCPSCGGSLCVEEYHECESDRAWRAAH